MLSVYSEQDDFVSRLSRDLHALSQSLDRMLIDGLGDSQVRVSGGDGYVWQCDFLHWSAKRRHKEDVFDRLYEIW